MKYKSEVYSILFVIFAEQYFWFGEHLESPWQYEVCVSSIFVFYFISDCYKGEVTVEVGDGSVFKKKKKLIDGLEIIHATWASLMYM